MAATVHERPPYLAVVHRFVNSLDVDVDDPSDEITDPAGLTSWLIAHDLLDEPAEPATRAQFRLAMDLRQALRALALANHGEPIPADDLALARSCFDRLPVVAAPVGEALAPGTLPPVQRALAQIVAGVATARAAGEWHRLRRCPANDCGWVFWDSSARAARRWCSMAVCGNRAKARAFSRRARPSPGV